jgi:hypothetical protein
MSGSTSENNKPDYYRLLSDMSGRSRQGSEEQVQRSCDALNIEQVRKGGKDGEDSSGRAGKIHEPEMTSDEFYTSLCSVLFPKDNSDKTTFRKIAGWVYRKCKYEGHNEYELCGRILDFAREANNPTSRNPRAVFMSILKRELGYPR